MAKLAWRKSPEPLYHHIMNNSARTVYLTTLTSPFFVPSSAIQNHRQFGNNPEIFMKSICINPSANLTQTSENSTKTKFANCAKDSLLMYLLIHLVFAWRRLAYDIYIWWNEVVNLFVSRIIRSYRRRPVVNKHSPNFVSPNMSPSYAQLQTIQQYNRATFLIFKYKAFWLVNNNLY